MKLSNLPTALCALALLASPAFAGGLSNAATSSATSTDWSGPYVGGFLGAGSYAGTAQDNGDDALDFDGNTYRLSDLAGEIGIVGGYNVQRGNFVYGAEIDFAASNFASERIFEDDYRQDADTENLLTIRARVGFVMDNTLIYGTAGYGRANIFGCASDDEDSCVPDDDEIVFYEDGIDGIAFGGGVEHRFTDAISVKAEYMQFESVWTDSIEYDNDETARFSADSKVIRVGVNYHF